MFVQRKLRQLRRDGDRVVAFAQKALRREGLIIPGAHATVEAKIARVQTLSSAEDASPADLDDAIKDLKSAVDAHLPLWRSYIVRDYAEAIVVALALALVIRAFVIQAFKIPSGSMIPTLLVGDQLIVNKFMYGFEIPFTYKKVLPLRKPSRGDIIVFRFPQDPSKDFIKRVIGTPGDVIEMKDKELYVNGEKLPTRSEGRYEYEDTSGVKVDAELLIETIGDVEHKILLTDSFRSPLDNFRRVVPENQYFCMGDNRDRSNDSRYWGFVDASLIRGKAMVIYFSWPPSQWLRIGSLTR